ncbi:MAG: hypothetical protein QM791_01740 [Ferruginibacter sp.]
MKKQLLPILFCLCTAFANAQLIKKPAPSGNFSDSLFKIVSDFRNNFSKLQGKALTPQPEAEVYRSTICLPGSKHCVIYRFRSVEDKTASWQGLMYAGEDFEEALKAYKNTFNQVKKSKMNNIAGKPAPFEGEMDKPDDNVRFAVSSLRLKTGDGVYKNMVAEVELSNNYNGWEVHLNIYTKKLLKEEKEEEE